MKEPPRIEYSADCLKEVLDFINDAKLINHKYYGRIYYRVVAFDGLIVFDTPNTLARKSELRRWRCAINLPIKISFKAHGGTAFEAFSRVREFLIEYSNPYTSAIDKIKTIGSHQNNGGLECQKN